MYKNGVFEHDRECQIMTWLDCVQICYSMLCCGIWLVISRVMCQYFHKLKASENTAYE